MFCQIMPFSLTHHLDVWTMKGTNINMNIETSKANMSWINAYHIVY